MNRMKGAKMAVADEINDKNVTLCAAIEARDLPGVVRHFADDAFFLMPGTGPLRGSENIQEWWKGFIGVGVTRAQMQTLDVEERGDLAIEIGTFEMEIEPAGVSDPITEVGKYVVVHRRDEQGELRM
jgi:ketosteroid isomerase-like protein